MYIFGGKGNEDKLSDTWKFNFATRQWQFIVDGTEDTPKSRSGHATGIYGRYMIIYGGIHDVCKELNDICLLYTSPSPRDS